jgi:hypothetical protein
MVQSSGQADAETEITPAMTEAGAHVIDERMFIRDWEAPPLGKYTCESIAREVFNAMLKAKSIR